MDMDSRAGHVSKYDLHLSFNVVYLIWLVFLKLQRECRFCLEWISVQAEDMQSEIPKGDVHDPSMQPDAGQTGPDIRFTLTLTLFNKFVSSS